MSVTVSPAPPLPLFRQGQWYASLDSAPVGTSGRLRLSLAPPIVLLNDLRETRRILASRETRLSKARRRQILEDAIDRFVDGTLEMPSLGRQGPADFERTMLDVCGLPPALVRRWSAALRGRIEALLSDDVDAEPDSIGLVSLPANTFTCLEACVASARTAGALWVRPSTREPVSALRFIVALLEAGWPAERLAFYGADHAALWQLVGVVDRATLYGGPDVLSKYGGLTHVDVQGPGRAVAVVDDDLPKDDAVAWLKHLVVGNGGRFCTNVGTIVSMQPAKPLGLALAEELDAIMPTDPEWPLAYGATDEIARVSRSLDAAMSAQDCCLTQRPMTSSADGRSFFAPTLIFVEAPSNHPLIGLEHPFPVAVVATVRANDWPRYTAGAGFVHRYPLR